ncbi:hypothetical protein [uncultured Demequina sp.]|uniref:hypothetical protein n=1 Tax=uncultured Demequina sp. TaxID=693499 RepID=UPI0025DAFE16|nr:hypothetical protein [uncultured Demequina sp.]
MSDALPATPVILHREPWNAVWRRLGFRSAILGAGLLLGGVPGAWGGLAGGGPLRAVGWLVGLVGLVFVFLSVANLARNDRALLRLDATGAIERPPSVQETWLGRPLEAVRGTDIEVTEAIISVVPSRADPRVTLTSGEAAVRDVPLHGVGAEDFVAHANALTADWGVRWRYVAPPTSED